MNKTLAQELGFLGTNVDSNFDIAWLRTEIANKVQEGDKTAVYKLVNFARHSEDPEIKDYAEKLVKIYADEIEDYVIDGDNVVDSYTKLETDGYKKLAEEESEEEEETP